jgi:hypothetical protein
VQVALEPAPFGIARLDDAGARAPELLESGTQVGLEPRVVERDARGGAHGADQLRLVAQRGVVDERRHAAPAAVHARRHPPAAIRGQLDRAAVGAHVCGVLGNPVGEVERAVAEGASDRLADRLGRSRFPQLDEQIADPPPREPRAQDADQERDRDRDEDDAEEVVEELGPAADLVEHDDETEEQNGAGACDDGREQPAQWRARREPAPDEDG